MTSRASFEDTMEQMRKVSRRGCDCNGHMSCDECRSLTLDALQAAHEREVSDAERKVRLEYESYNQVDTIRKREFKRGFDAGREMRDADEWALERERKATIQRLREGCSDLAHAFRDGLAACVDVPKDGAPYGDRELGDLIYARLIHLLGGTDGSDDIGDRDATADGGDGGHVQPKEVADGGRPDDCHRAGDGVSGGAVVRVDGLTAYDVLGNERHEAVCGLRMLRRRDRPIYMVDIACAIGAKLDVGDHVPTSVFDRLIHLLGGDQPTLSDLYGIWKDSPNLSDSPKKANKSTESDAQIAKSDEDHRIGQDNGTGDGTSPDDVPSASITDELRVWAHGFNGPWKRNEVALLAIADRIDERFARAVQDAEQEVHDAMEAECNKLAAERDKLMQAAERDADQMESLSPSLEEMTAERDELRRKLDAIAEMLR